MVFLLYQETMYGETNTHSHLKRFFYNLENKVIISCFLICFTIKDSSQDNESPKNKHCPTFFLYPRSYQNSFTMLQLLTSTTNYNILLQNASNAQNEFALLLHYCSVFPYNDKILNLTIGSKLKRKEPSSLVAFPWYCLLQLSLFNLVE